MTYSNQTSTNLNYPSCDHIAPQFMVSPHSLLHFAGLAVQLRLSHLLACRGEKFLSPSEAQSVGLKQICEKRLESDFWTRWVTSIFSKETF